MILSKPVKKLILGCLALYLVVKLLRWRKTLAEWNHSKVLALKLPAPPVPKNARNSIDFYGCLKRSIPEGEDFNPQTLSKYFISCLQKLHKDHGSDEGLMCLWVVNPRFTPLALCHIVVWDMDIVRELTSAKLLPLMVKSKTYAISADFIGNDGIVGSSHSIWHPQRVVLERGFTEDYVHSQAPLIKKTAEELMKRFSELHQTESDEENYFQKDIVQDMRNATMDVFGRVGFSYDIGCINDPNASFSKDYETAVDILQQRVRNPLLYLTRNILPTQQNKDFKQSVERIDNVIKTMISERMKNNERECTDLLDILLEAYKDGVKDEISGKMIKLTESQILCNMRTLFFAAHDTTAAALSWAFYLLSKHPRVIEKIMQEFEENDRDMGPKKLELYHYLNAVVLEVLRMYPSTPFFKESTEDITVGNGRYVIPKGVEIGFHPFLQQRDPKYFEKPNEFIPERWIDENQASENLSLQARSGKISLREAFFPFALGARNCVGRKLALLEMRIFILEMLKSFHIKLPDKMPDNFQEEPYLGAALYARNIEIKMRPKA